MELTNEELKNVDGGSLKLTVGGVLLIVGSAAVFALGVLKGVMGEASCSLKRK